MYGFFKNIDEIVNKEVLMDFAEKRNEIECFQGIRENLQWRSEKYAITQLDHSVLFQIRQRWLIIFHLFLFAFKLNLLSFLHLPVGCWHCN